MTDRMPLPEKEDYELIISNSESRIIVRILEVIGLGGSCIVYKGKKHSPIDNGIEENTVIIKEFYPAGMDITRLSDMSLQIPDELQFNNLKAHFVEGQSNHVRFYEYYQDQSLPRMFFYGSANNTVYAVSDTGKGGTLSQINFDSLSLNRIASIMDSVCLAIRKIHVKEKLYLDCKPDNFFYYGNNSDLQSKVYLFDFDTIVSIKDMQNGKYIFCTASFGWVPPEQELLFNFETGIKQYRAPQQIGYHTDIFSVGAVFFWLLTHSKPTDEHIKAIQSRTFNWENESRYCSGVEKEIIRIIQDIAETTLQPDVGIRSKMFRHYIAINAVRKQFENLYGLSVGDNVHYEPIHDAIKHMEEELLLTTRQIHEDVKKVSDQISNLQISNCVRKKPEIAGAFCNNHSTNRFQYTAESAAFEGRKAEFDYLLRMCIDSEAPFCWTGICGSGGAGKSRLAYELCKYLHNEGWKIYAPSHARITVKQIKDELNNADSDAFICFDDVRTDIDLIIDFIYHCTETQLNSSYKTRLVVIERDFSDSFLDCSNALIYRYQDLHSFNNKPELSNGFIRLNRTVDVEICEIMTSYALNVYNKKLSDDDKKRLYAAFKAVDQQERPLFALFISDAWCNGNDVRNWHMNDALEMVSNKEYEKALNLIKTEYDKKSEQVRAFNAVKCVITLSAFLNQIDINKTDGMLNQICHFRFDDSFLWILEQLELVKDNELVNTFPDVLSEYLSMRYINTLTCERMILLFNLVLQEGRFDALFFGDKICKDYADALATPSNMSVFQFLVEEWEVRVGEYIIAGVNEQELEKLENLTEKSDMLEWLKQHFPNYQELIYQKSEEIIAYFLQNKDMIFKNTTIDLSDGVYSGQLVFDWRCGRGKQEYDGGVIYEGEWNKDFKNGKGKMVWPDGTTYEGEWKDGKIHGHGFMMYASGSRYEGEWSRGKRWGKGILTSANGEVMEGLWEDNCLIDESK